MSRVADPSRKPSIPRAHRGRRALVLAAAAAVLVPACGGDTSSEADPAGNPNDPRDSPLAQLLGYGGSSADQRAKDLEVQQQVAQCMQDEGWEYTPVDWQAQMGDMSAEWELQLSDPEAYGEKYGYGVVRSHESQDEMMNSQFEDPNSDYTSSLTADEQQAYYETLYGEQPEFVDGEEFVMPPMEEQGCQGTAMLAVYGENSAMTNSDVQMRVNEMFESMESDPDVARALDEWAACMREQDASYDWDTPDEVSTSFWDRLSELQGFGPMSESDDGSGGVVIGDAASGGMPEIDDADLEELRRDELATWRHDWDCQQEVDLARVRLDAEQRMVDELISEFPELGGS